VYSYYPYRAARVKREEGALHLHITAAPTRAGATANLEQPGVPAGGGR
jgi:hypothetical protein